VVDAQFDRTAKHRDAGFRITGRPLETAGREPHGSETEPVYGEIPAEEETSRESRGSGRT
jgi:hypothetical protein